MWWANRFTHSRYRVLQADGIKPAETFLVGREDAGVQLDVSGLVHTVHVTERCGDAEVRGHGPKGLLYSPDLVVYNTIQYNRQQRRKRMSCK